MTDRELLPCPLCGVELGYRVEPGDTYRWSALLCRGCNGEVTTARVLAGAAGADQAWNDAAAYAESLRKDAKRYRWLRNRLCATLTESVSGSVRPALNVRVGLAFFDGKFRPRQVDDEQAETLDTAIDAAMAAG